VTFTGDPSRPHEGDPCLSIHADAGALFLQPQNDIINAVVIGICGSS
jgi:hypothetical protein